MPPQARVSDMAQCPADAHGCPACPHPTIGPATMGSPDVITNGLRTLRLGDTGVHAACCGPNKWTAIAGSGTVFVNSKPAVRQNDTVQHCGGVGRIVTASPNVITGG